MQLSTWFKIITIPLLVSGVDKEYESDGPDFVPKSGYF